MLHEALHMLLCYISVR